MSDREPGYQSVSVRDGSAARPAPPSVGPRHDPGRPASRDTLIDVLDRVLDKGVVIAGDVTISLLDIELLTIKIRLLIASVDKAKEMGIDWWARDPQLSGDAKGRQKKLQAEEENRRLRDRIGELERRLSAAPEASREQARGRGAAPARRAERRP